MKSVSTHKLAVAFATLVAAGLLCAGCSESLRPPNTSPLTDAEKRASFFAVTHAGGYILAANSNGFFRALSSTKKWERLSVSRKMSPQGQFAISQTDSNSVFYWPQSFEKKGGLFVSHDAGATWNSVCLDYSFEMVYPNLDGRIYAIVRKEFTLNSTDISWKKEGSNQAIRWLLLVSENQGKSWRDITGNIAVGVQLITIFSDPASPKRVCVVGNCVRNYVYEPTDDSYSKWNSTRELDWRKASPTADDFLRGYYTTTTVLYELNANLQNYFDYDFGISSQITAFVIEVDTNHLEFASGQKIQLPVTVKFLPDPDYATVKFVDATNNEEFWRIQCICPDGKRVAAAGRPNRFEEAKDSEKLKQRTGDNTGFQVVELSSTNSYSRVIALDKLTDFSKPGSYRVRLSYDSIGWGWEDKRHSGIWGGGFSSPIFTLTIKP